VAEIRTVAVIGAGTLGSRIAYAAALAGYRTILEDIVPASLRRAERNMSAGLDAALGMGLVHQDSARAALDRLEYASTVEEAARQADLVIEAVPDELESKLEIFVLLDRICKPETLLASTSVSVEISEIASVTYRADKCVGVRFANASVEVVRAPETSETAFVACLEVGRRIGSALVELPEQNPTTDPRRAGTGGTDWTD
jgi:3-hydroxybutyryl-CoA dehydrogenase